ncbi:hypothetical protein ACSBR2_000935 [Camellia fascicularis]
MSTTQRSESMHAFFDGYVNSKTTLKQFVEQYENALAKKVENENNEEFNSFNSCIPCMVGYEMEKQVQSAYTTAKFKEFQRELMGKISCDLSSYKKDAYISKYEVAEDILFGESRRRVSFNACFDEDTNEDNGNMHGARVVELVTEENIHLHSLHIRQESYDYNRGLGMWPNMTSHPSIIGMSPYFGQPNLLQGGSSSFQASMFRQGVGMYPFKGHHHPSPSWRPDLEMGGVMHPNNFNGMLTMNDMAQAKTPTLHKDDKSEEH